MAYTQTHTVESCELESLLSLGGHHTVVNINIHQNKQTNKINKHCTLHSFVNTYIFDGNEELKGMRGNEGQEREREREIIMEVQGV